MPKNDKPKFFLNKRMFVVMALILAIAGIAILAQSMAFLGGEGQIDSVCITVPEYRCGDGAEITLGDFDVAVDINASFSGSSQIDALYNPNALTRIPLSAILLAENIDRDFPDEPKPITTIVPQCNSYGTCTAYFPNVTVAQLRAGVTPPLAEKVRLSVLFVRGDDILVQTGHYDLFLPKLHCLDCPV